MRTKNRQTAPHYLWGANCDGWRLEDAADLSVIEERMPPGTTEDWHYHTRSKQVFYVLAGALTLDMDGQAHRLTPGDALCVIPGVPHQARNEGKDDAGFLVISSPNTRGDRQTRPS
ncbi:MAG: cupin domain-containing protein [Pseudomonadota bacterium]